MRTLILLLIVLACPLMMIFMMRGHGHGAPSGHAGRGHSGHDREEPVSVDDLRRRRDELDRQIAEREWQGAASDDRGIERV